MKHGRVLGRWTGLWAPPNFIACKVDCHALATSFATSGWHSWWSAIHPVSFLEALKMPNFHAATGCNVFAEAQQVVGSHRVPITFKQQMHLIDVLSLEDPNCHSSFSLYFAVLLTLRTSPRPPAASLAAPNYGGVGPIAFQAQRGVSLSKTVLYFAALAEASWCSLAGQCTACACQSFTKLQGLELWGTGSRFERVNINRRSTVYGGCGKSQPPLRFTRRRLVVSKLVSSMDQTARVPSQPTCQTSSLMPLFLRRLPAALRSLWCARTSNLRVLCGDALHRFANWCLAPLGAKSSPFEPRSTHPKRRGQKRRKCSSCNDKTHQTYLEVSDGPHRDDEDCSSSKYCLSAFFVRRCAQEFDWLQVGSDPSVVRGLSGDGVSCTHCNVTSIVPSCSTLRFACTFYFFDMLLFGYATRS